MSATAALEHAVRARVQAAVARRDGLVVSTEPHAARAGGWAARARCGASRSGAVTWTYAHTATTSRPVVNVMRPDPGDADVSLARAPDLLTQPTVLNDTHRKGPRENFKVVAHGAPRSS